MDHVFYADATAKELERLIDSSTIMIIRSAAGRKLPYGRVDVKDVLYFIRNNDKGKFQGKALVKSVLNSEKLEKEASVELVESNQNKLQPKSGLHFLPKLRAVLGGGIGASK